jgi:hypothetical protein
MAVARGTRSQDEKFISSFQRIPIVPSMNEGARQAHRSPTSTQPTLPQPTPSFAKPRKNIPPELQAEISDVICSLARQKMFLIMHWCIFLGLNTFGLFLAYTAYSGYIGDEFTKSAMGLTPMFFINTIALACLSPIKGTKIEVARLKEKLKYLTFQVEYHTLF